MTETYKQTDFDDPAQTGPAYPVYPRQVDKNFAVHNSIAGAFAAHEAAVPDMTVVVDAGRLMSGQNLFGGAQQVTATITAPVSDLRNDIVVINSTTAIVSVVTGVEDASPSDPSLAPGEIPVARINLDSSTAQITNLIIDDLRPMITNLTPPTSGVFSPELWDASNSGSEGQTYTSQSGSYTIIDNRALVSVDMTMSSLGSLNLISEARIGNLPFVPEFSGRDSAHSGFGSGLSLSAAGDSVAGTFVVSGGIGYIALNMWSVITGTSLLRITNVSSDGVLKLSGHCSIAV